MKRESFVDHVQIYFRSGNGGRGHVSFRKEKFVPEGGPDGGDGGNGGDIILKGDSQLWTLLDLRYRKHISAENGGPGGKSKKSGKAGKSEIVPVPLGIVAKNMETGDVLGEITTQDEELLLVPGGRGGKGNWRFRSATNQTPEYAQEGIPGTELTAILELKLLADVGLVGFPNAGKSTLLSVLTAAKPKIADYPFTTLVPNLGIVKYRDFRSFVMADIPGIIEGAAEGRGLGIRFLRHIERNSILLFMIPADTNDHLQEYQTLLGELEKYNPELLLKERIIVISKSDILDQELRDAIPKFHDKRANKFISSITGEGLEKLKDEIWSSLNSRD